MDPQVFEAVLGDIGAGEATHRALSEHGIPRKAFYAMLASDTEAGNRYARAKQTGLEVLADEIIEISDDGTLDTFTTEDGLTRVNTEIVARAKLRVDSRKWLLSKLVPKKYGDKVDLTHAGDPSRPLITRVENVIVDPAG